ncbi:MAG: hypothetical protein P9M14_09740 [Candidatus Alcyoniella australis]|nr:hypothetical protein [Candidatus Alcyoniella australis]
MPVLRRITLTALAALLALGACDRRPPPDWRLDRGCVIDAPSTDETCNPGQCLQLLDYPYSPGGCDEYGLPVDDYCEFIALATRHAQPMGRKRLKQRLLSRSPAQTMRQIDGPLLADTIVDALNIGFLLEGLERRPLHVYLLKQELHWEYERSDLLFVDPYVGAFHCLLLIPRGPGPFPALIALHGHGESPELFVHEHYGGQLAASGYIVLIPELRCSDADAWEDLAASELLLQGFSLLGLHAYEALLGQRFLETLAELDPGRVGLVGHSGGSVLGNLLVWIDPRIGCYVSDCQGSYLSLEARSGRLLDEMLPALHPFAENINRLQSCPARVYEAPYGFADNGEDLFEFLGRCL